MTVKLVVHEGFILMVKHGIFLMCEGEVYLISGNKETLMLNKLLKVSI